MPKKAATQLSAADERYKAQIDQNLAETKAILKRLAAERVAYRRRERSRPSILEEVKAILSH